MSLDKVLQIGKSAIFANQIALSTTGHNIANVNTPDYSRQEAVLQTAIPDRSGNNILGNGVDVSSIKRHYDRLLQSLDLSQRNAVGSYSVMSDELSRIEVLFSEASGTGFSNALGEFFSTWHEVANNPESSASRQVLLSKSERLVQTAKSMEGQLESSVGLINSDLKDTITRVNTISSQIAELNKYITSTSQKSNDLLDQRDALLGELSELIDFNQFETSSGAINVIAGRKSLVTGDRAVLLEAVADTQGDIQVFIDDDNVGQFIRSGRLGGLLQVRDNIRNDMLQPFREMVGVVVNEVNTIHRQGYGLDGTTGVDFFEPSDTSDLDMVIKDLKVNITDPLQVASALGPALPGDNRNALLMTEIQNRSLISGNTLEEHYSSLVTSIGALSRAASDSEKFESRILSDIEARKDAVSGVSLDEEAADMIRFQRAFEAGARLITITDELLESVINLGRS